MVDITKTRVNNPKVRILIMCKDTYLVTKAMQNLSHIHLTFYEQQRLNFEIPTLYNSFLRCEICLLQSVCENKM